MTSVMKRIAASASIALGDKQLLAALCAAQPGCAAEVASSAAIKAIFFMISPKLKLPNGRDDTQAGNICKIGLAATCRSNLQLPIVQQENACCRSHRAVWRGEQHAHSALATLAEAAVRCANPLIRSKDSAILAAARTAAA